MTAKKENPAEQELVRDYLTKNPDFFEQNSDIFEVINISHDSGKAISLVERQIGIMRERNSKMITQIDQMQAAAKENALLMEKTNRLVLNLVQANDLNSLGKALTVSLKSDFSTEFFSLTLINKDPAVTKNAVNFVSENEAKSIIGNILSAKKAICGKRKHEEISLLFGNQAEEIGSVLALPLRTTNTFGVLALGHSDPEFYTKEIGTVFIDYIGDLLSELIPKHINPID
jgi:uncharacterized protein YigA (DUF484 family)